MAKKQKENYPGAILIAHKLYEMFIGKTSFINFEKRINENYQGFRYELEQLEIKRGILNNV